MRFRLPHHSHHPSSRSFRRRLRLRRSRTAAAAGRTARPTTGTQHRAPVTVMYCGDSHMKDGLLISVLSLTEHVAAPLNVLVLTASLSNNEKSFSPLREEDMDEVRSVVRQANPAGRVRLLDITRLFNENPPTPNIDTRFTPYCMLRLYADLLPEVPDRVLYLDTDIVCRRPFEDFYTQDMDGRDLVAVLDYYGRWFFRRHYWHVLPEYFNSGMLLLNMAQIRRDGLFERCRRMCSTKWMFMPDQSSLNKLCRNRIIAPRRYNDQRRFHEDTVFQHFTTSFRLWPILHTVTVKPWQIEKVHSELGLHEYDGVLSDYERLLAARNAEESHPDSPEYADLADADLTADSIAQAGDADEESGIDPVDAFDRAAAAANHLSAERVPSRT